MFLTKILFCHFRVRARAFGPFIGQNLCFWLKYSVFWQFRVRFRVFANPVFLAKISVFLPF